MQLSRRIVDKDEITFYGKKIASECKRANLDYVLGGSISHSSISVLNKLKSIKLDRYETRKIVFVSDSLESNFLNQSLNDAINFELLWLLNKREYYKISEPIHYYDENSDIVLKILPSKEFSVTFESDFPFKDIGKQKFTLSSLSEYIKEIFI